jgi:hypothetical protein
MHILLSERHLDHCGHRRSKIHEQLFFSEEARESMMERQRGSVLSLVV